MGPGARRDITHSVRGLHSSSNNHTCDQGSVIRRLESVGQPASRIGPNQGAPRTLPYGRGHTANPISSSAWRPQGQRVKWLWGGDHGAHYRPARAANCDANEGAPAPSESPTQGGNAFPTDLPTETGPRAGPTQIGEEVTLSPDGDQCARLFRLDAYDTSGNISTSFTGVVTPTRIIVNTKVSDLL